MRNSTSSFTTSSITLFLFIAAATISIAPIAAAQITPGEFDQFNTAIGQRVETAVVLGTANSATTGGYKWQLNNATGTITRATWEFNIGNYHPIDLTNLKYVWTTNGGVGYADYHDEFLTGQLAGDNQQFQSYALGSEIGPRIFLTDDFSVLPQFGLIYGYTTEQFHDFTGAGTNPFFQELVNWQVQTLSVSPALQFQYEHTFSGVFKIRFRSDLAYYTTFPIQQSTHAWAFRSKSQVWDNSIDLDYKTGLRLLDCNMHIGGNFSRVDLFDGIAAAMDCSHFYNIFGRVTLDTTNKLGFINLLGLGSNYTWGTGFHGYAVGVLVGVSF
jgi:hypothetical protein